MFGHECMSTFSNWLQRTRLILLNLVYNNTQTAVQQLGIENTF